MFRIVVYGPPLAGKTTMMKAFADHHGLPMRQIFGDASYGANTAWRGLCIQLDDGELATICGAMWTPMMWNDLLTEATDVLFAVDGQAVRELAVRECLERLASHRVASGCLVRTKNDLLERRVSEPIDLSFLARTTVAAWPVFEARHDQPETLWSPLDWLVKQARRGT
jgi:signal recognition particle receptor subunit beta